MQIPSFWAEALATGEVRGRPRTVRRFGWSDRSEAEARQHAEERAWQSLLELQAGRRIAPRERKLAYGGEGLPIREQVIARSGADVVTRNRYGARCLNEPDVWFGDLDLAERPLLAPTTERLFALLIGSSTTLAIAAAVWAFSQSHFVLGLAALVVMVVLPLALLIVRVARRSSPANQEAHRARVWRRIVDFTAARPDARIAVYETPAGLRLLALHRTFDPTSDEVQAMFGELGCDPAYAHLCRLQACFRTRISAKPWRIGLPGLVPRTLWPTPFERLDEREEWIEIYEAKARDYAACRFVEELGQGPIDPRCADVRRMHDEMCRARSDLPLA
ncbi:MAG: hypothetical protein KDC98_20700 [Planctomycetes bacterium]|nr:hypothetical protein [Planctomycetota bacterium]